MAERCVAFPPIIGGQPRLLILGSMPGAASLRLGQYYGHPRNGFWPIMMRLLGAPADLDYAARLAVLIANGIALWDVLAECERRGSLDADICPGSIRVNEIGLLLDRHPGIRLIAFNGATAEREFRRRVWPNLDPKPQAIPTRRLPSTSPAHAGMTLAEKRSAWEAALACPPSGH